MPTKPNETGWTTADPKVDGVYWWRADESDNDPDIHFVQGESFYQVGFASSEFTAKFGGEWFGPISPSDFEQLIRLRKAVSDALEWIEASLDYDDVAMDGSRVMTALREALANTGEQS